MTRTANMMMQRQNSGRINRKRMWMIGILILFVLIFFSVYFFSKTVTAQRNTDRTKLVTSIEVKKGDTLWSIASNYITDDYSSMNDYINEIKDSNGLDCDTIHVGNYIIVPYYADATR